MVIHPSQIEPQARRILEAMELAEKRGAGAVSLDGKMIDIASIRQAEATVRKAELAAAKDVS